MFQGSLLLLLSYIFIKVLFSYRVFIVRFGSFILKYETVTTLDIFFCIKSVTNHKCRSISFDNIYCHIIFRCHYFHSVGSRYLKNISFCQIISLKIGDLSRWELHRQVSEHLTDLKSHFCRTALPSTLQCRRHWLHFISLLYCPMK